MCDQCWKKEKIVEDLEIVTSQILAGHSSHWTTWSHAIYYCLGSYAITVLRVKTNYRIMLMSHVTFPAAKMSEYC